MEEAEQERKETKGVGRFQKRLKSKKRHILEKQDATQRKAEKNSKKKESEKETEFRNRGKERKKRRVREGDDGETASFWRVKG